MKKNVLRTIIATACFALLFVPSMAIAAPEVPVDPGLEFNRGNKLFAAGDYRGAAKAFEEAYRLKPHHAPLWNAARSWQRAGEPVRAANLYLKYLREAPEGTRDRDLATASLTELSAKLGKILLRSIGPTDLKIDDTAEFDPNDGIFVAPGDHTVSGRDAAADGGVVRKSVTLAAGQVLSVTIEPAPPKPPKNDRVVAPPPPANREPSSNLPYIILIAGGALTVVGGGLTVWSGLDTNSKRSAFDTKVANGTAVQSDIDDGKDRQTRTNIFLGATVGVFVLTGIAALAVNWATKSSSSSASARSLSVAF